MQKGILSSKSPPPLMQEDMYIENNTDLRMLVLGLFIPGLSSSVRSNDRFSENNKNLEALKQADDPWDLKWAKENVSAKRHNTDTDELNLFE